MANVQSNPISEYDFAEELDQELNEHDPPQVNKKKLISQKALTNRTWFSEQLHSADGT